MAGIERVSFSNSSEMLYACNGKCSSTFSGYNMWAFRQGLKWLWCLSSPFQVPKCGVFSSSHLLPDETKLRYPFSPHTHLISLGRQLPRPEGIQDIICPGSQFWQLGDQNKGQCHALLLPTLSVWPLWLIKANSILGQSLKSLSA